MKTSRHMTGSHRAAAALILTTATLIGGAAHAQAPDCAAALTTMASERGVALKVVLDRLDPDQRATALGWADCTSRHLGLAAVTEQAVRALDAAPPPGRPGALSLYISPSQSVFVSDPEGAFPRSEVISRVNALPEARAHAAVLLGPGAGQRSWAALMADLNAETHALSALSALKAAGLLDRADASELATVMLTAAAWLTHAQQKHPLVFERLAASSEAVDAFGLVWGRAQRTLLTAHAADAAPVNPFIKGLAAHEPALEALFKPSGLPAPDLKALFSAATATPPAQAKAPDPPAQVAQKDPPAQANANPPANTPAEKVAKAPQDPTKPADNAQAVEKKAESPEAKEKEGESDAAKATKPGDAGQGLGLADKIRLGVAAALLLVPWILIGIMAALKRRRSPRYARFANRTLAVATLLMVFEALAVLLLMVTDSAGPLFSLDGLFLAFGPYFMTVAIVMTGRIDAEGQLASRQLIKKWSKWIGLAIGVIAVANVALVTTIFILTPHFIMIPSMLIVALIACVFLVKLWRTGDAPLSPDAQGASGAAPPAPDKPSKKPAPDEPPAQKPAQKADAPKEAAAKGAAPKEAAASKGAAQTGAPVKDPGGQTPGLPESPAARVASLDIDAPPSLPVFNDESLDLGDDDGADNAASAMSDDDLAAALEKLGGAKGGDDKAEKKPSALSDADRDALYKLLGD